MQNVCLQKNMCDDDGVIQQRNVQREMKMLLSDTKKYFDVRLKTRNIYLGDIFLRKESLNRKYFFLLSTHM